MRGLTILDGKLRGRFLRLPRRTLHVGRDPTCQIRIESTDVSRFHCRLRPRSDGCWEIADLGSRNGTFVNDVRVEGRVVLRAGDVIRIGPMGFQVPQDDAERQPAPGAQRAAERAGESVLEDEIAAWLGADGGPVGGGGAKPVAEAESGETTIFRGEKPDDASTGGRLHRTFASIAEEAADIIARHRRLHGAPASETEPHPPSASDAT
jgi:pSer/pThr/pTyr-binding forkhead associated (FHA) protein